MNAEAINEISPIEVARKSFNLALFDPEISGSILLTRTLQLQNALISSDLSPEKIYNELAIISSQAVDKVGMQQDNETILALRELKKGFELTAETFKPRISAAATPPAPARTASLPPMTGVKGGETRSTAQSARQPKSPQTETESREETLSSFLKQKRIQLGLSQMKLGRAAGNIPQGIISHFERLGTIDQEKVKQLAAALNLSEEDQQKFQELFDKKFS